MWEIWIFLFQRFLQKERKKKRYNNEIIRNNAGRWSSCRCSGWRVSPSLVAPGWKLHRRTGCCWRPAGVEGSDLLQRTRKMSETQNVQQIKLILFHFSNYSREFKLGIIICPRIYRCFQFHPVLGIKWQIKCLFFLPLSCLSLWKKLLKTQYKSPHNTNILIILIKKNNVNHPQSQTGFSSGQQQVDLTEGLPDLVQLVHVRLPGPQRDPRQQLREHTTNRPHVHRRAVLSVSHQQLRGPVPTSRHVVRVVVTWSSWWHRNTWHEVWTGWAIRSWWRWKKTCKDV